MEKNFVVVMTTCATQEEAEKIVEKMLKARLIACANILPDVLSLFHWKGDVNREQEG